jgi:hypothetical protein
MKGRWSAWTPITTWLDTGWVQPLVSRRKGVYQFRVELEHKSRAGEVVYVGRGGSHQGKRRPTFPHESHLSSPLRWDSPLRTPAGTPFFSPLRNMSFLSEISKFAGHSIMIPLVANPKPFRPCKLLRFSISGSRARADGIHAVEPVASGTCMRCGNGHAAQRISTAKSIGHICASEIGAKLPGLRMQAPKPPIDTINDKNQADLLLRYVSTLYPAQNNRCQASYMKMWSQSYQCKTSACTYDRHRPKKQSAINPSVFGL